MKVRTLRLSGVYESQVEGRVSPLYERFGREAVTILAGRGVVDLVLMARGDHADARLAEMDEAFSAVAGDDLFGRDEVTLPAAILALCRERGWKLATAESCTGGLVAAQLTSVAGSSDVFVGSVVAYANELKEQRLGVPRRLLEEHGAVSQETAEAMARGALGLGAEVGLAITGIAGPGGGSDDKPVGTVHVAAFTPIATRHRRFRFPGDRAFVRECATNYALDLLRRTLREA
jgi:nicotinamide-nucleotide amidase